MSIDVFNQLLSQVEAANQSKLTDEKLKLMHMAVSFRIHDLDSANEIRKLLERLEELANEASQDPRLSANCRQSKPAVLQEVRDLLLLKALTCLKYSCANMDINEKCEVMHMLIPDSDFVKIDKYRMQCLGDSVTIIDELVGSINSLNVTPKTIDKSHVASQTRAIRETILPQLYFACCFVEDNSRIKELFNSKKWNYGIERYIVELKTILQQG